MKEIVKATILISILVLITVMTVAAISEEDIDKAYESISTLTKVQSELKEIKGTTDITKIINLATRQLSKAISNPGPSCASMLNLGLLKLNQALDRLTKRTCANSKRKNCIQDSSVNQIVADLQNATNTIKEVAAIDEDGNKVPDVCDNDPDGDGISGKKDNCPLISNPDQIDADKNGTGDECELFYCCEDSSLTFPLEECELKIIASCSKDGGIIIGGIPSLPAKGLKNKVSTLRNRINFGGLSTVLINTGFFPFESSQDVLDTFNSHGCSNIELTLTPPVGFPGGTLEVGPAANNFETGPRTPIEFFGDMSSTFILDDFPTFDPTTRQPFAPSMGDELGLSFFTTSPVFVNSSFTIFTDLAKSCLVAPASSSGAVSTSSGGTVVVAASSSGDFNTMLTGAISMSTVPVTQGGMQYMATTYDCDDFANDLERELDGQGFDASFTTLWRDNGMWGHCVTDVHSPDGMTIFVEPQNGMIIDLDEDGDGMVGSSDGTHSMNFMTTEGMTQVEVYMDQNSAVMAGVTLD